jgi:hypothetical protein
VVEAVAGPAVVVVAAVAEAVEEVVAVEAVAAGRTAGTGIRIPYRDNIRR